MPKLIAQNQQVVFFFGVGGGVGNSWLINAEVEEGTWNCTLTRIFSEESSKFHMAAQF